MIPYLPVGLPDLQTSRSLLPVIGRQGADLIALGTSARLRGLEGGGGWLEGMGSMDDCLSIAAEARRTNEVPLVLVCALAEARDYGFDRLVSGCAEAGIDGVLIPDISIEGFGPFGALCMEAGVDAIQPVSDQWAGAIAVSIPEGGGFAYCTPGSSNGVRVNELRQRVLDRTGLPLVVGMEAVAGEAAPADGILVGRGMDEILVSHPPDEIMLEVSDYVRGLKEAATRVG